jgi:hypothetical protein
MLAPETVQNLNAQLRPPPPMPPATPDLPEKNRPTNPQRVKELLNKGAKAVPQFHTAMAKIEQEPDPMKRYQAHKKLKADNADWLAHPGFANAAKKADDAETKALGLALADPKKRKKLEAIATADDSAGGGGGGGGDDEAPAKADAKPAGGGHALHRAAQGLQTAHENLHAVLDDPHSTDAQVREAQDDHRRWSDSLAVAKHPPGNPPPAAPEAPSTAASTPPGKGPPPPAPGTQTQPDADSGE